MSTTFVARSVAGQGWQVWNRKTKRRWGPAFKHFPDAILAELNGLRRSAVLTELVRKTPKA